MDDLQVLDILLDAGSPMAAAKRMAAMKVQRADEFATLHRLPTDVPVAVDARYANATVTNEAVQAKQELHAVSRRVVSYSHVRHTSGELGHYFDGVWVMSGPSGSNERLVCYWLHDQQLVALHYCRPADAAAKQEYIQFLNQLNMRWLYLKQQQAA
jgi:hypothetical protein